MEALGPGALGQILDDARGHAAGDAEGVGDLARGQTKRGAHSRCRAEAAENRRGMKAGPVLCRGRDEGEPADELVRHRDALQSYNFV